MRYSAEEIMQYIAEEDVKFIRLAFCDVFGRQKNVSIMPGEIARAFRDGISIDASAISGFGGELHSDLLLHPDSSTLAILPWRPEHGRVVRMYCSITYPDGTPFACDTRWILQKAIMEAKKEGLSFSFGSEMEFYLFKLDENGEPTRLPYDKAGYMDIAPDDKCENVRREICLTLEQMGIRPESSHHEEGPGQNEIDFRYSEALTAADNAVTFRSVVKTIAARNGLHAEFSPKPLKDKPGSGFHINISAKADSGDCVMPQVVAGIMKHIREMTVFLNPVEESYYRLGNHKAPKYITWSENNRSQLVRIPSAKGEYVRAELRSPDPLCNPYLAFALLISSGLEGYLQNYPTPESHDINLYTAPIEVLDKLDKLPLSLKDASRAAAGSKFISKYLPKELIRIYCR